MPRRRTTTTTDPATLPVIAYLRVSTDEQANSGAGLAAQRHAIELEAQRRGWGDHLEWVTDEGCSAKNLHRPGITSALDRLANGDAGTLVVAKLDRLSRSVHDFAGLLQRAEREGWALIALDPGVDMTTASGKLVAGVMATVAEWESAVIGERTRDALATLKASGVRLGRPVTVDPATAARIVAARQTGATYAHIADELNIANVPTAQGGARWWPGTVRGIALATLEPAA
jgi:DNA invertase Pin-like site-specific DNA recombinase